MRRLGGFGIAHIYSTYFITSPVLPMHFAIFAFWGFEKIEPLCCAAKLDPLFLTPYEMEIRHSNTNQGQTSFVPSFSLGHARETYIQQLQQINRGKTFCRLRI